MAGTAVSPDGLQETRWTGEGRGEAPPGGFDDVALAVTGDRPEDFERPDDLGITEVDLESRRLSTEAGEAAHGASSTSAGMGRPVGEITKGEAPLEGTYPRFLALRARP